jgi:VanZ family protein
MAMRLLVRLSALAAMLGLLSLMLSPPVHLPGPENWTDKTAHVVGFFTIALALQVVPVWRNRLGAALLAVVLGALVEIVQGEIGRDRSALDLLADAIGAGLAWLASPRMTPLLDWLERR